MIFRLEFLPIQQGLLSIYSLDGKDSFYLGDENRNAHAENPMHEMQTLLWFQWENATRSEGLQGGSLLKITLRKEFPNKNIGNNRICRARRTWWGEEAIQKTSTTPLKNSRRAMSPRNYPGSKPGSACAF